MPLDPDVEQFLTGPARALGFPAAAGSDPAAAAEYITRTRAALATVSPGPKEPVDEVTDEVVDGAPADAADQTPAAPPVRIYRNVRTGSSPILLYFHGGGWVVGGLEMNDALCRRLTNETGCVVVSVDYRLAPEHPYPAAVDDAVAALQWVRANAERIGGDPANVVVGGTSAGGNVAAALALVARDRGLPPLRAQLLLYPVIDAGMDTASYRDNGSGYFLGAGQMRWYWEQYLGAGLADPPVYAAPAEATDLAGLPPALVVSAEYDPLRDEAEQYAGRLVDAGVPTRLIRVEGQIHGFLSFLGVMGSADAALADVVAATNELLA